MKHILIDLISAQSCAPNTTPSQSRPCFSPPSLERGTILAGITRDTLLHLAQALKIPVEVRDIPLSEVIEGITHGQIVEVFGTGTAATIMPIISLYYADKQWELPAAHPVADTLSAHYKAILSGNYPAPAEWIWTV